VPNAYVYSQTPAVDANYVYQLSGNGVMIVNRLDGTFVAAAPASTGSGGLTGYLLAPVLTAGGRVLAVDALDNGRLLSIDTTTRTIAWRGPTVGGGAQPVTTGNTIYSWTPMNSWAISALDASSGAIQWTWTLPATDSQIIGNMVLTENLLFLSSDKTIYAIDLATHQTVWTYPTHGRLSISSSLILYVYQTDYGIEESKITAIRLT
jgi:outer membrane protein assembly factor BamB